MIKFTDDPGSCRKCGVKLRNRAYGQRCEDCFVGNSRKVQRSPAKRVGGDQPLGGVDMDDNNNQSDGE